MKRNDWVGGKKNHRNFCEVCGNHAGDIDGLCLSCKKTKESVSEKEWLLNRALHTEEGLNIFARAMANPIRRNLDYQGVLRRAIQVEPYDADIQIDREIEQEALDALDEEDDE